MAPSLVARRTRALGSTLEMQLAIADPDHRSLGEAALASAEEAIRAYEARFSRFIPTSELCALNAAAGDWFLASPELFAIISDALVWARATGGLFDPLILPALRQLGYDRTFEEIAHRDLGSAAPQAVPRWTYADVTLDPQRRAIRLPLGGAIDLGGIGKGWIADAVLAGPLGAWPDAMVSIGGDLAVRGGPQPGRGWIIGLRDPRHEVEEEPTYLGGVELRAGGIATSGAAWHWWLRQDTVLHHLIDPRTGRPATLVSVNALPDAVLAVTALARSGAAAEVRAKEALLLGLPAGLAMLDGGDDHAGIFIMGGGSLRLSANLHAYLKGIC